MHWVLSEYNDGQYVTRALGFGMRCYSWSLSFDFYGEASLRNLFLKFELSFTHRGVHTVLKVCWTGPKWSIKKFASIAHIRVIHQVLWMATHAEGLICRGRLFLQRRVVMPVRQLVQVVEADCNYSNLQLYWSFKLHLLCVHRRNWKRENGPRNEPVFIIWLQHGHSTSFHSLRFSVLLCMTVARHVLLCWWETEIRVYHRLDHLDAFRWS